MPGWEEPAIPAKGKEKGMYINDGNAAYDLSLFDTEERTERRAKQRAEEKVQLKIHRGSVAKSGNWFKTIVAVSCVTFVAFSFLNCKATLSELSSEISDTRSTYEEALSENARLQTTLDNMVTLSKVEETAVNDLGLQKTLKSQVRYINGSSDSLTQIAVQEENVFVSMNEWFNGIMEYLGF